MSISLALRAGIEARSPFHDRNEEIIAEEGGLTVRCEIRDAETLGCALTKLEMASAAGPMTVSELARTAERFCEKVNYLLEPLQTIEVDPTNCSVLVRSKLPRRKDGQFTYYELCGRGDRMTVLRRFCYDQSVRTRSAVAFLLTNEQLEMLVEDLAGLSGQRIN